MFSSPVTGSIKKVVARTDKNRGESPKSAIVVPEARPIWFGNDLEAANKDEKYLNIQFRKREGHIICQNLRKHSPKAC
jgi:hypothetical protein